jgi:hypothetical protein
MRFVKPEIPDDEALGPLPGNWQAKCSRCHRFTTERKLKPVWPIAKPVFILVGWHDGIKGRFCNHCRFIMNLCVLFFAIMVLVTLLTTN